MPPLPRLHRRARVHLAHAPPRPAIHDARARKWTAGAGEREGESPPRKLGAVALVFAVVVAPLAALIVASPLTGAQAVAGDSLDVAMQLTGAATMPVYDSCTSSMAGTPGTGAAQRVTLQANRRYYVTLTGTGYWGSTNGTAMYLQQGGGGQLAFRVNQNGQVIGGTVHSELRLIYHANASSSYTPFVATVAVRLNITGEYYIGSTWGGSCYNLYSIASLPAASYPPGTPTMTGSTGATFPDPAHLVGYVGAWNVIGGCCTYGHVGHSGVVLDGESARGEEAAMLAGETTRSPVTAYMTWKSLNKQTGNDIASVSVSSTRSMGDLLADGPAVQSGNSNQDAQAFAGAPERPYIWRVLFELQVIQTCSGAVSFAVSSTNAGPMWDRTTELSNITVNVDAITTGSVRVAVDFREGLVDFDNPLRATASGAYTYGAGGGPVAAPVVPSRPYPSTSAFRVWSDPAACGLKFEVNRASGDLSSAMVSAKESSADVYSTSTGDWSYFVMYRSNIPGSGTKPGGIYQWRLNATPQNVGGALYLYLRADQNATAGKPPETSDVTVTTDAFGAALTTGYFQEGGSLGGGLSYLVWEVRLGFLGSPNWTGTQAITLTVNATGALRNLVQVGTLVTQPSPRLHVGRADFDKWNNVTVSAPALVLYTADALFTQLTLTVRECADAFCTSFGAMLAGAGVVALIPHATAPATGEPGRQVVATTDSAGTASMTGADLRERKVRVNLTLAGYTPRTWYVDVSGAGEWAVTVGLFPSGGGTGGATGTVGLPPSQGNERVTWTGNTTRVVPDAFALTVTRQDASTPYILAVYRWNATARAHDLRTVPYTWTGASVTLALTYPGAGTSEATAAGSYLFVAVHPATRAVEAYATGCLQPAWEAASSRSCAYPPLYPADEAAIAEESITEAQRVEAAAEGDPVGEALGDVPGAWVLFLLVVFIGIVAVTAVGMWK